ncbi:MAG: iron-containing alcohol dehydrogenase [Deltaproteobacteria bacterium]|jgi:3-deoxy-alpha-D-manno-octulosonate 8-oxidase|nr:iron-containing alcohol dehydrogenase [Deltaproteobacteria bacterium]
MSLTRNTKSVPAYLFGSGALAGLGALLEARRPGAVLFYVDHFFQNSSLLKELPRQSGDELVFVDTSHEPTVEYVDSLAKAARAAPVPPVCLVGLGGGSVLDVTKAVANLLTNPGKAEDYQGWDLLKNPAVYKIGVPTLSGTGAECSRTCVLTNSRRGLKLGMNSDFSLFDQLILDPALTRSVPREQFLFSGLDTFMHCFESLRGAYRNLIVDALATGAQALCQEIFLGPGDMMDEDNRAKMMVASYLGGTAAGNVGLVHPFSAGLSMVLHIPHGRANCHALSVLGEFYPEENALLREILARQKVSLPGGICAGLTEDQYEALYQGSIIHEKPLSNALGPDFRSLLTRSKVLELFRKM